jgi:hypothetical protein
MNSDHLWIVVANHYTLHNPRTWKSYWIQWLSCKRFQNWEIRLCFCKNSGNICLVKTLYLRLDLTRIVISKPIIQLDSDDVQNLLPKMLIHPIYQYAADFKLFICLSWNSTPKWVGLKPFELIHSISIAV